MIREEYSCGVIVVINTRDEYLFLLLHQKKSDSWSFPKGRINLKETPIEGALRELKEETGITECLIGNFPSVYEEYTFNDRETPCHKIIQYFIGIVNTKEVLIQKEEIIEYKWVTFNDAFRLFNSSEKRKVLKTAFNYINNK
jgi:8-oxo-dGTP pyrophosphatase MutT (NUDIX family)